MGTDDRVKALVRKRLNTRVGLSSPTFNRYDLPKEGAALAPVIPVLTEHPHPKLRYLGYASPAFLVAGGLLFSYLKLWGLYGQVSGFALCLLGFGALVLVRLETSRGEAVGSSPTEPTLLPQQTLAAPAVDVRPWHHYLSGTFPIFERRLEGGLAIASWLVFSASMVKAMLSQLTPLFPCTQATYAVGQCAPASPVFIAFLFIDFPIVVAYFLVAGASRLFVREKKVLELPSTEQQLAPSTDEWEEAGRTTTSGFPARWKKYVPPKSSREMQKSFIARREQGAISRFDTLVTARPKLFRLLTAPMSTWKLWVASAVGLLCVAGFYIYLPPTWLP